MNNTRIFSLLLLALLLTACNSIPIKEERSVASQSDYERGMALLQSYEKGGTTAEIKQSLQLLEQALEQSPDNVFVQKANYAAAYAVTLLELTHALDRAPDLEGLKQRYYSLHPLIQDEVLPPTRLAYAVAYARKAPVEEITQLLQQMIREQPRNASNWYALSTYYEEHERPWLSLAAAVQAQQLNGDSVQVIYQLGDALNDVAQLADCVYEQKAYLKRSVYFMARAAAKSPEQMYLSNTALQYLRLGLFPMGYQQSKKAWQVEQNKWSATRYVSAAIRTQHYDDARAPAEYILHHANKAKGHTMAAQLAMVSGKYDIARQQLQAAEQVWRREAEGFGLLTQLQVAWVSRLLGATETPAIAAHDEASDWEHKIASYMQSQVDVEPLEKQAQNSCQMTEAYFYMGYKSWLLGDVAASKHYLEQTLAASATLADEYTWARVLLDSDLFNGV